MIMLIIAGLGRRKFCVESFGIEIDVKVSLSPWNFVHAGLDCDEKSIKSILKKR